MKTRAYIQPQDDGRVVILLDPIRLRNGQIFAPNAIGPLDKKMAQAIVEEWANTYDVEHVKAL